MQATTYKQSLKQPKVFLLSIITSALERFGFYVLANLFVLYATTTFGFSDHTAFLLYGVFNALVYITPTIGGYLADNVLGIRQTIMLGILLEGLGLTCLAIHNHTVLLAALALIMVGVGFFKTGPTNLMARAYKTNDPRIDGGFTWFYMAINVGAVFSPIIGGIMQRYIGWYAAFLTGAVVLYFNLFCYYLLRHRIDGLESAIDRQKLSKKTWLLTIAAIILTVATGMFLLAHILVAHMFFVVATAMVFIYFTYEARQSSKQEGLRIIACLALIFIGMVFFIMYFQLFMSIVLFIMRSVRHNILGYRIPTTFFLALNPFWIIVLSPILVWIYNHLGRQKKDLSITTKFPLGLLMISLSFIVLKIGTFFPDAIGRISGLWVVLALGLLSLGELLVSALGVAMVTRIAPKRMYGVMMGAWFLVSTALGSTFASYIANLTDIPKTLHNPELILGIYAKTFLEIGIAGIIITVFVFFLGPYIKRMANIE